MPRKKIEAVSNELLNQLDIPTMKALTQQLKGIDPELLGKRLRRIRIEKRLSQRDICKDLFTSAYLSSIELGKTRPTLQTLLSLAQRLGETIEYFLLPAVGSFQTGKLREALGEEQLDFLQTEFHLFQAEIALELGNLPMAQQELEPVKEVILSLNKNIQSQYFLLSSRLLGKQGVIDQALTELEKGYSLEETPVFGGQVKNGKDLARQYELEMGRIYRLKGNYVQALAHFQKGLSLNPDLSAETQNGGAGVLQPWHLALLLAAGETSQLLGEPEQALSFLEQRNSVFDNASFTGLSETFMRQAQASFSRGDFLKSAYLLGQSLQIARGINEGTDRLEVSLRRSQLNLQLENLTKSKEAALDVEGLVRLIKPGKKSRVGSYEFSSKLLLAQISLQEGNVSQAQSHFDQAKVLFENTKVELGPLEKAHYFQLAGRVYGVQDENEQANQAFERAIQNLEQVDSSNSTEPNSVDSAKSLLGELYFEYSQLLKKAGKLNESMDYIEKAYRLKSW